MSLTDLETACNRVLIDCLPASLKAAIREARAKGATRKNLLRVVRKATGGRRGLTALGVEALLDEIIRESN
jgi:hypothetical protein